MKKMRLVTILLLSFMLMLGMSQAVFAETFPPVNGGTYTFTGSEVAYTAGDAIDEAISGMEPGDDVTITFNYTNKSSDNTYWYLENSIIKTLEDASEASGGGYAYSLKDGGTTIFKSDAVGGDAGYEPSGIDEGLAGATNATEDWFFIRELAPGASGQTKLYIAMDGESQVDSYMTTTGKLQVNYAVDTQPPGEDIIIPPPSTKTGDSFNPWIALIALLAAVAAAILAISSYRKDRKDGENA